QSAASALSSRARREAAPGAPPGIATVIRDACADDVDTLARIHAACFAKAWDAKTLGDMLKSPGILALSAPHGFVLARVAADEAEILTLAVAPEARRQGLARALVVEAVVRAHAKGAAQTFLEVSRVNTAARALYGSLGFAEVGTRKSYYEAGED